MMILPSMASNSSTRCVTSGNWEATDFATVSNRPSVAFWIVYFELLVTILSVLRARLKAYRAASSTALRSTIRRLTAPSLPIIRPGSSYVPPVAMRMMSTSSSRRKFVGTPGMVVTGRWITERSSRRRRTWFGLSSAVIVGCFRATPLRSIEATASS